MREPVVPPMSYFFALGDWHLWFAWRPVLTFDRRWVWLCRVHRRCMHRNDDAPFAWPLTIWLYAAVERSNPDA